MMRTGHVVTRGFGRRLLVTWGYGGLREFVEPGGPSTTPWSETSPVAAVYAEQSCIAAVFAEETCTPAPPYTEPGDFDFQAVTIESTASEFVELGVMETAILGFPLARIEMTGYEELRDSHAVTVQGTQSEEVSLGTGGKGFPATADGTHVEVTALP